MKKKVHRLHGEGKVALHRGRGGRRWFPKWTVATNKEIQEMMGVEEVEARQRYQRGRGGGGRGTHSVGMALGEIDSWRGRGRRRWRRLYLQKMIREEPQHRCTKQYTIT